MSVKPVGVNTTFASSTSSTQSVAIPLKTDSLRVVAEGAGVYVAIGANPTATVDNLYVPTTIIGMIGVGLPAAQRVVGYTTGSTTILDFPEGTGSPFAVGDAVTLSVTGQADFDFEHKIVTDVDASSNVGGYFSTRITVDHDSSGVSGTFNPTWAELRKSVKVAVKTNAGTGTVFIQCVQVS
jgi:hypothetical protein